MLRRENLQALYPLSPMQEGMLFHAQHDPASTAYLEQLSFTMRPAPAPDIFDAAWALLFRRHDILRTVFMPEASPRPLQAVLKEAPPRIRREDLGELAPDRQRTHLAAWKEADRLAGFDLAAAPPIRLACFDLGGGQVEIIFTHHHILMDGWCLGVLQQEFVSVIDALERGQTPNLPPPTPFARYIDWLGKRDVGAARAYWRGVLAGDGELASIVRDSADASHRHATKIIDLDPSTGQKLRDIALQAGATAATMLHAIWGLSIGRLLDREDVVFGSIVANRPEEIPGIERMLGLFINALPVRVSWADGASFLTLLTRLQSDLLARRPHEFLPLTDIQACAGGRNLFDHVMLVQNYPIERQIQSADGARINDVQLFEHTHYKLAVSVVPGSAPSFHLDYDQNALTGSDIARIERRLRHLVALLIAEPARPLTTLPLADDDEQPALPEAEIGATPGTIDALIAAAAHQFPDRVAVRCGDRTLSYAALDRAANTLAHHLRAMIDLRPDDRIGLLAQRSELLPVAMLAIAKAGAAYVPIDPSYPPERIRMLCQDSACRMVLAVSVPGTALPSVALDAVPAGLPILELTDMPIGTGAAPTPPPRPSDLLYVAYTSGSTGRPKGVMIEHRSVAAFAGTLGAVFGLPPEASILALTTITFDISVLELLCSLAHGMTVVIAPEPVAADGDLVLAEIAARNVTVLQATPSRVQMLLEAGDGAWPACLRTVLVGGEKLPPALAARLLAIPNLTIFNVYGPTEATIWSTAQRLGATALSIGTPLPGEYVAILSRNGRLCPPGTVGEICIGGVGLARGYLGRPDLTEASHLPHPAAPNRRLYRTGDLGRWRDDGEIDILGRRDDQLKIRGYRIEPGEITSALENCPGVRQAVIRAEINGAHTDLIAYVAASGTDGPTLRHALGDCLPAWMVPTRIVVLDALPLLPSGKVDRTRLPPASVEIAATGTAPRDRLELRLTELFGEVLGNPPTDIAEDFFSLGGHSLKAAQLIGRLRKEFSRDLRLRDLFAAPTVAGLAATLRRAVRVVTTEITRLPEAASYALSPAQRRMWVLERMLPGSGAYLLPAAFEVAGAIDPTSLHRAVDALAERHEALRTIFPEIDGEPRQVVLPPGKVAIAWIDLPAEADSSARQETIARFFAEPFDLERRPPLRVAVLRQGARPHILLFALHHIAADGQSLAILQRDLGRLYGLPPDRPAPPAPRHRYRDIAAWQNALLNDDSSAGDREFWHQTLTGDLPPLDLATDHPRPPVADPRGAMVPRVLGLRESNTLRRLARQHGATPFMAVAALVATLLHRQGAADIRLGFPVAGRTHPDLQDIVGVFINTLVLRLAPDPDADFAALLDATRLATQQALDHQTYPFDRLVDELKISRDPSRSPIFDVMITFEEQPQGALRLGTARVTPLALPATASRFDLTFSFADAENGALALAIEYRTSLFTEARIVQLGAQLNTLLAGIEQAPGTKLAALPLLTHAEQDALIAAGTGAVVAQPRQTLPDLLQAQALRTPDAIALRFRDTSMTYGALDAQANRLARRLIAQGVGPGDIAAILLDRSPAMIVAMLAILKAGAAYLPIDPSYPAGRIGLMLKDSKAQCLLTSSARLATMADAAPSAICLDDPALSEFSPAPVAVAERVTRLTEDHIAYVIYTSGSTGQPKGAAVYHRGVTNLLAWYIRALGLSAADNGLLISAFGFDLTQKNVFAPLLVGASLRIPHDDHYDADAIVAAIAADAVTWINATPSAFYPLLDQQAQAGFADLASLRWVVLGGEPIQLANLRPWLSRAAGATQVMNSYGPTECTDIATAWVIDPASGSDLVPLGHPIDNVQTILLDAHRHPAPRGAIGDLWIGGAGVGAGYLRNDALNAAAFADIDLGHGPARMYRTGDLGRLNPDNSLLFLGRADHQVKIRGFRVEPGEIEAALIRQLGDRLAQVAVIAQPAGDDQALIAYLVAQPGNALPDGAVLRAALATILPAYMVPAAFVVLPALPLTPNGKLDRAALPAPAPQASHGHAPPQGPHENLLHALWATVLGATAIGRHDNFFELGGHSLRAVRLITLLRAEQGIALPLSAIFTAPTIAEQAALIAAHPIAARHRATPIAKAPPGNDDPLTPAQRRLWLLAQTDFAADGTVGANAAYGLAAAFEIAGALDRTALAQAFADLVDRHDSLRTIFPVVDGTPRAVVLPTIPPVLRIMAASDRAVALAECKAAASLPFDLSRGPLLRAQLWPVGDGHILLIGMHHIVGDERSLDVAMGDLVAQYDHRRGVADARPRLRLQARDFAIHQAELFTDIALAASRAYWLEKLAGDLPVLEFPTDRPRPAMRGWRGNTVSTRLPAALADRLDEVARGENASLHALLVTLTKTVLHRHCGQTDIILGAPITGRDTDEIDDQIGFYVETVALRDLFAATDRFADLLRRVGQTIDEAIAHRHVPFDTLIGDLDPPRDAARNPIFDAMLVFGRDRGALPGGAGLRIDPLPLTPAISKFDLTFHFTRDQDGLDLAIEYRTDLFNQRRMERLLAHFVTLARSLPSQGSATPIGQLTMIPPSEQAELAAFGDGGRAAFPLGRIEALFAAQVAAHPDRPAIIAATGTMSYRDLDRQADAVAALLRGPGGLRPGETVLVSLDRGAPMLAALLGILKAQGTYMPADRQHPPQRIDSMVQRGKSRLAFAETAPLGMTRIAELNGLTLFADTTAPASRTTGSDQAAYLIFTSGSTGEPKGVVLGHAGFVNMIAGQIAIFGITAEDRVVLFASPSFDASMSEIFMALLAGAALVPATAAIVADAPGFADFLRRQRVTVATLPPTYLAMLNRPDFGSLRVLLTAGEAPIPGDLRHYAPRLRYFNAYGPTETSVCASIWSVPASLPADGDLPIGRPLPNTEIQLLGAQLDPVPIGATGEICVAGPGLAIGYLDDRPATERAFPFQHGKRLYRTGDRGFWRDDGQLVYAGRLDQQVKIRGQRVEPAEIERSLTSLPEIAQALVLARGDGPVDRHLIAWLVARDGAERPAAGALRTRLAALLPRAMVPTHLVWIDAFPRTVNGKIDQRALPDPEPESAEADDLPRNDTERVLAGIFAKVLGRAAGDSIGIHSHFFDLGGDSIRLLQVAAELARHGMRMDIGALYRTPTIAALSAALDSDMTEIDQSPIFGPAPLTATQTWFFRRFCGNRNHFNQSVLLRPRERLDPEALQAALAALVRHHASLRLRIAGDGERRRQEFGEAPPGDLAAIVDLRADAAGETAMQRHAEQVQRSLDIAAGRMLAAALYRLADHDALLLVVHHLAIDAVSWRILLDDLSAVLAGLRDGKPAPLPPHGHSARDWAEHQARIATSPALEAERAHWTEILASQAGQAPGPLSRRATLTAIIADDELPADLVASPTIEPLLLASFARALSRQGDGAPVIITLEGHGREPIADGLDVSRAIGWFTAMHPVRLDLAGLSPADALAETVRSLASTPNRGVGFGIFSELVPDQTALPAPAGGIAFNYLGRVAAPVAGAVFTEDLASLGDSIDPGSRALFGIDLLASHRDGALHLHLAHDPEILTPAAASAVLAAMAHTLRTPIGLPAPAIIRSPVRPYIELVADDHPLILNPARPHVVAAMPPLFGYGAAFRGVGEKLPDIAFHAFDFIETDDRIARYVRAIGKAAVARPVTVLGYSGGGNLGFAVAKGLEAAGVAVRSLILLDAPMKRRVLVQDDAAIEAMMTSNLDYFRARMGEDADYRAYVVQPELRAMMLRRMEAFIRYLNAQIDDGRIAADIHLVRSSQIWAEPDDWSGWADRTTGRLVVHQGAGIHAHMTEGCHLDINAAIIASILRGETPAPYVPASATNESEPT